jgi:hypothetical protein
VKPVSSELSTPPTTLLAANTGAEASSYLGDVTFEGRVKVTLWMRRASANGQLQYYARDARGNEVLLKDSGTGLPVQTKHAAMARARELMRFEAITPQTIDRPAGSLSIPPPVARLIYRGEVTYAGRARMSLWERESDSSGRPLFYAQGPRGNRYLLTDPISRMPVETKADAMTRARELMVYDAAAFHPLQEHQSTPSSPVSDVGARSAPGASYGNSVPTTTDNWIYENLRADKQHVYTLWDGPHDYMVRLVMDQFVGAVQPANITLKSALSVVNGKAAKLKPFNFTVRHESSSFKVSTGSKLQFGYDVTREDKNKRLEYTAVGEPVMDLISIEAISDQSLDRLRAELKFDRGVPSTRLVMQNALSLGGHIRWRRVWEDPRNGQLRGIDVVLSMKTEGAIEAGYGASPGGIEGKAEIEASVRFFGGLANKADIHRLQTLASQSIAELVFPIPEHPVTVNPFNNGDKQAAAKITTAHLAYGASVWQLAPDPVSGGKNNGHMALDLAIRVNRLLRQSSLLQQSEWVTSTQHAERLLSKLWQSRSPQTNATNAQHLSNPLHVNFGLRDIETANAERYPESLKSFYVRGQRKLFLGTF